MLDLKGLNASQREAVETVNGVVQVASVAGSGKTRVLIYRIAYMIKDKKINPRNIMVTTFTKKAAEEMIGRLRTMLTKDEIANLVIGTFHSIGYRILKTEYRIMNHPMKDFELINGAPQKWLVKEAVEHCGISTTKTYNENVFAAEINKCKMSLITPDSYIVSFLTDGNGDHERNVLKVYTEYERLKNERKLIDFNDMLYKTYWLLNSNPQILKRYQKQFQYILCDEAQDNNFAQYELLKLLAEPQNNIFIVGDDDQSIYKFRGAVPEKFIGFKDEFDTKIINLQENYRSKPYILQTANKLIKNNKIRVPKELIPFRKDDNEVACYVLTANEDAEANVVVKKILELEKTNKSFNHMAILYRTNAQARAMEDQLISNGIPYVIFNGISFYERSEVKDIMAYLKLAASNNNNDNESLERIINKPSRYLGAKFMESVKEYAKNNKCNYFQAICSMNHRGRTANNVRSFIKTIIDIQDAIRKAMTQGDSVGNMIEETIRISNFKDYLSEEGQDEEDNIRIENLKSLITAGSRYFDAESFIKYTDLVSNASKDKNIEAVKLMTIHKSKGLEEDMIFIIGASEGLLPHRHAIDENDMAIEEERRLMYVAITRAKDYLLVTSPKSYQGRSLATSRFIKEAEFKDITDELSEAAVEKSDN